MTAGALVVHLRSHGVRLWMEGDRLRYLAPSGVLGPDLIAMLRERKSEIGELLASHGPIPRVSRSRPIAQSFSQQRIWALSQLFPDSAAYNIAERIETTEPFAHDALEQSFTEIVRRHEILRTTFAATADGPVQMIGPAVPIAVPVIDVRPVPANEREAEATRILEAQARVPFDLSRGPLLRAMRIDLSDERQWLLIVVHHIAADAWSMRTLFRELALLYDACRGGRPSPLPDLPIQYADFASWQRARLRDETVQQALEFWRSTLHPPLPSPPLLGDRPRSPVARDRGAHEPLRIPPEIWQPVQLRGMREGATAFMTLVAALGVLLHRHGGQTDIIVGTAVTNRPRAELEPVVGPFLNTLPVRLDLSGDPSFRDLLMRLRRTTLDAYAHQDLPFERLVEELHVVRDLARDPLVQVMLTLHNAPQEASPRSAFRSIHVDTGTAKADLAWFAAEANGGLTGWVEYRTDLFERNTIERLLSELARLLTGIGAEPDAHISQLPLLSAAARKQVVHAWNHTALEFPADASLAELFAAQAARTPEAVAVADDDEAVTYAALHARVRRLGARLRRLGVGPERVVGLCLERSIDLIVALLGVLEAGGAYLPLDPGQPPTRIATMLADAGVAVWITDREWRERLPAYDGAVVSLDDEPTIAGVDGANVAAEHSRSGSAGAEPRSARGDRLAYVIYTSGSTGRPKGVAISQRAAVNCVTAFRRQLAIAAGDVMLAVTTVSFDIALLELYLPLTVGARVVIANREAVADGCALQALLQQHAATVLQATPTTWRLLLESGWTGGPLRQIWCGGEALPRSLADALLATGRPVWNLYGPTETTVWSTAACVEPGPTAVSIGRPIANTQAYVVDAAGEPVPIGAVGELTIGGAGLARGYVGQAAQTAAAFVPDPFATTPGARLYRTGDLARWRADGRLECLGRRDQQVKLHGHRIELGEIEAALAQHVDVRAVAVSVDQNADGHARLVAYIVGVSGTAIDAAALQRFARGTLPAYMVPSLFVPLDALPLTPNGKLDRKALPRPDVDAVVSQHAYIAPRSEVERQLAATWTNVLKVARVGVHDNFFELGGDSILAVLAASQANQRGLQVSADLVFQHQTLAELAAATHARDTRGRASAPASVDALDMLRAAGEVPSDMEDCYLLSPLQRGMLFDTLAQPGSGLYIHQVMGRIEGRLDRRAFERAWRQVIAHHAALRTCFVWDDLPRPVQVVKRTAPLTVDRHDWRDASEAERDETLQALLAADVARGFDVLVAPLLRVAIVEEADDLARFIVTYHHLVVDGWSMPLVLRDVWACYQAFTRGEQPALVAPTPYRNYIDWLQRQDGTAAEAFWRRMFDGFQPVARLAAPQTGPMPRGAWSDNRTITTRLTAESTAAVRGLAQRHRITPATLVQAGWAIVVSRHSATPDVVFGVIVSGRPAALPDVGSMVGMFINGLAIRIQVPRETPLLSWLHEIQSLQAQIREFEYSPLSLVRKCSGIPPNTPLFESNLVFENYPVDALARAGRDGDLRVRDVLRTRAGEWSYDPISVMAVLERQLFLRITYDSRRVVPELAARMLTDFAAVIDRMPAHLSAPLGDLVGPADVTSDAPHVVAASA